MDRKKFITKLNSLKLVAHRLGYQMTNYPENSLNVLQTIFENNEMFDACNGFEFDICFTKDHIPVVIHDKYIDDISDSVGLVKSYTMKELEKANFGFRKSLQSDSSREFKIVRLEELLKYFYTHKDQLKDKIIKIETKEATSFNIQNLIILADILNKFSELNNNLIHLSFYPQNLIALKRIQSKKNYSITKSDLLCDYRIMVNISKIINSLDYISLRIKTTNFPNVNDNNSKRVNNKISFDTFFMKFSNAISEKTLRYAINKYGSVGLYVLNDDNDICEFCKRISDNFFENNYDKIVLQQIIHFI